MIHRYLATAVGVMLCVLAAARWLARRRREPGGRAARLGAGGARLGLRAGRVRRAHRDDEALSGDRHGAPARRHRAAGAARGAGGAVGRRGAGTRRRSRWRRRCAAACGRSALLALLQIALGGWVSTNYAVLACGDFPTCQGQWWPQHMDFEKRLHPAARTRPRRRRRLAGVSGADGDPLRAPADGGGRADGARAAGLAAGRRRPAASPALGAARRRWRRWPSGSSPAACPTSSSAGRSSRRWPIPAARRRSPSC